MRSSSLCGRAVLRSAFSITGQNEVCENYVGNILCWSDDFHAIYSTETWSLSFTPPIPVFLLGLIGALQIGFVFVFVVRYIVTGDGFTVTFNRRHEVSENHVRTFY